MCMLSTTTTKPMTPLPSTRKSSLGGELLAPGGGCGGAACAAGLACPPAGLVAARALRGCCTSRTSLRIASSLSKALLTAASRVCNLPRMRLCSELCCCSCTSSFCSSSWPSGPPTPSAERNCPGSPCCSDQCMFSSASTSVTTDSTKMPAALQSRPCSRDTTSRRRMPGLTDGHGSALHNAAPLGRLAHAGDRGWQAPRAPRA
mmetsp:Transcript_41423/g.131745  ORF Transcript_41423/g.131745 Transcript_41423/m.131745 type:complete len:204 (+) Transcript_41423:1128-1739(+)